MFLGRLDNRYLRHDGPEHVMAFAPTRSGKGVGLVIPTLLSWPESVVVHDIKGENWQLTAGWRARFSHCLLFNPTDTRSCRVWSGPTTIFRPPSASGSTPAAFTTAPAGAFSRVRAKLRSTARLLRKRIV